MLANTKPFRAAGGGTLVGGRKKTLARPYANALFDLARGDNALHEWSTMLNVLLGVEEEKVQIFLEAPENSAKEKALRLSELCGEIDEK